MYNNNSINLEKSLTLNFISTNQNSILLNKRKRNEINNDNINYTIDNNLNCCELFISNLSKNLKKSLEKRKFSLIERGRKPKKINKIKHKRDAKDNIRRRIKKIFFDFMIYFVNSLLNQIGLEYEFRKITYKEKEKSTKNYMNEHFTLSISKMFQMDSDGNLHDLNYNKNLYLNKIKDIPELQIIFNLKVSQFYKNIFLSKTFFNQIIYFLKEFENESYINKFIKISNDLIEFANIREEDYNCDNIEEIKSLLNPNDFLSSFQENSFLNSNSEDEKIFD